MSKSLGTFIRERRQDLGLTQEQLAERVGEGVRQSEISRLEAGGVMLPRRDRLVALAAALEVSVGDMLLKTGWIEDGHLRDFDGALTAPLLDGRSTDEAMSSAIQDLSAMLDALVTGRARLTEAARVMEQAEQTISSLLRSFHFERNIRGEIRPPIGVIKRWETTRCFRS
jgi:transcriptional regulator with XRE-family HTH domain